MKILVTGFEPFNGEKINPSLETINLLPKTINGVQIETLALPTVFWESTQLLSQTLEILEPDVLLSIGQAGGRAAITVERVAINQDDAVIPDNKGQQPIDQTIQEDGEPAYFSSLPIKAITAAIQEAGLPAAVSNTAGTYVCNHIMYQGLYQASRFYPQMKSGFIHIPFIKEQVVDKPGMPALTLEEIVRGIEIALETVIDVGNQADQKLIGGATH